VEMANLLWALDETGEPGGLGDSPDGEE
jgi:hypothetical protein